MFFDNLFLSSGQKPGLVRHLPFIIRSNIYKIRHNDIQNTVIMSLCRANINPL